MPGPSPYQTLDDYVALLRLEANTLIDAFLADWKKRAAADPDGFPTMMRADEWEGQFEAYCGSDTE